MNIIQCKNLEKEYHKGTQVIRPLADLNLNVSEGAFLALMGPSGSGKTTLLNLIAGIDRPTSGSLIIDGENVSDRSLASMAEWRSKYVGYIFQLYNLVPVLTAYENVELPLLLHRMNRKERHERVTAALELAGIVERHDHFPRQLSGGQEQRVAIARALVSDPKIIVADEPTGDLDKNSAHAVMELFQRFNRELGKTVIMVTHDPATAEYAETILHLEKGRLIERQTKNDRC